MAITTFLSHRTAETHGARGWPNELTGRIFSGRRSMEATERIDESLLRRSYPVYAVRLICLLHWSPTRMQQNSGADYTNGTTSS